MGKSGPGRQASAAVVSLPVAEAEDEQLVEGLVDQHPAAVSALFGRYAELVRRVLVRTLGNSLDVEDLAQDTFLTVIRRCHTLRDAAAIRSFVVSVAIRVAKNELRKRAIRRFVGLDSEREIPVVDPHDAVAAEGIRHLYQALDRLDADGRIAFVLRHVEGCDLAETAAACGCSLATIKRRLSRAQKRFSAIAHGDPVLRTFLDGERRIG